VPASRIRGVSVSIRVRDCYHGEMVADLSLGDFLQAGFRAREQAGIRSVVLDAECTGGRSPDMSPRDYAAQFARDLQRSRVTEHEHICLWARYVCEGRVGWVPDCSGDTPGPRTQATAAEFADFIEQEWGLAVPRFTPGGVKVLLASAEEKLRRRRPWMRRDK